MKGKILTVNDVYALKNIQIPTVLFVGRFKQLTNESRLAYALLLNQVKYNDTNLLIKEDQENKRLYFECELKDLISFIKIETYVIKSLLINELVKVNLLKCESIPNSKKNKYYLKLPVVLDDEIKLIDKFEDKQETDVKAINLNINPVD